MALLLRLRVERQRPLEDLRGSTCSFQRKSRRAVDSTCWACRYSASTNTVRITGVMTLRDTLLTMNGLQRDTGVEGQAERNSLGRRVMFLIHVVMSVVDH